MVLFSLSLCVDDDSSMSLYMENDSSILAKLHDRDVSLDADVDSTLKMEAGNFGVDIFCADDLVETLARTTAQTLRVSATLASTMWVWAISDGFFTHRVS